VLSSHWEFPDTFYSLLLVWLFSFLLENLSIISFLLVVSFLCPKKRVSKNCTKFCWNDYVGDMGRETSCVYLSPFLSATFYYICKSQLSKTPSRKWPVTEDCEPVSVPGWRWGSISHSSFGGA
jgi:hypothetical protein